MLLTGAAGAVASMVRPSLRKLYNVRLSDKKRVSTLSYGERFVKADLRNFSSLRRAVRGVDAIIHLGAVSKEGPFKMIELANIAGIYNVLEAARLEGVKRLIFASSGHVTGFYPRSHRTTVDHHVRPDTLYAASKAFGEALSSLYADKHGLEILCIRIGHVTLVPQDTSSNIWVSPDDLLQLIRLGLESTSLHYDIVYGVSDNPLKWWDNSHAERLGYRPKHSAAAFTSIAHSKAPDSIADFFQGGNFASRGFAGKIPQTT